MSWVLNLNSNTQLDVIRLIISLCKLDEILLKKNYFEKSFLIDIHFISQN